MGWPNFSPACIADVARVLRSGRLTGYRANADWGVGPQKWSEAYALEREVEKAFRVKHAIAVSSGTAALHAALGAMDLRGRGVVTSPLTFSATVAAIMHAGGFPQFADVDPHTFCITKESVKRVITKKTAAILPVHLFGYFADLSGLEGFGIPIIEDACQSVGASRSGTFAGTRGVCGALSFNGSKNLPSGEGGALLSNDDKIAEKASRFINHGENFQSETVGVNYRMHEIVAVLASHGLRSLEERNQRRRDLAHEVIWRTGRDEIVGKDHVYYVFPMLVRDRPRFIARCAKRGLQVQESYTTPLNRLKAFRKYQTTPLPVTDELHDRTLCLLTTLTPDRKLGYAKWCAKVILEALE